MVRYEMSQLPIFELSVMGVPQVNLWNICDTPQIYDELCLSLWRWQEKLLLASLDSMADVLTFPLGSQMLIPHSALSIQSYPLSTIAEVAAWLRKWNESLPKLKGFDMRLTHSTSYLSSSTITVGDILKHISETEQDTDFPISSKAEIWRVYFQNLLPAGRLVLVSHSALGRLTTPEFIYEQSLCWSWWETQ